jgi:putative transposase
MADEPVVSERGLLTVPDEVWNLAVRRAEVIAPLARADVVGLGAVDAEAAELGVSRRKVYLLLGRWRRGEGAVSDLLPSRSDGGRERRIAKLDPRDGRRRREGTDTARALQSAGGLPPPITTVLEQVQIDHTVVDLEVVGEQHRLPIGRPYVTAAIDVFSRSLVGLVVTLEAPSATSVGLCLAHMVTDKRSWLERLGVEAAWPMSGKPGRGLRGQRREVSQRGAAARLRPARDRAGVPAQGQPHYGGIVERVIGTMMQLVHELPGTTFSNPAQRGGRQASGRCPCRSGRPGAVRRLLHEHRSPLGQDAGDRPPTAPG